MKYPLLLLSLALAAIQDRPGASIEGVAVDVVTNEPIAAAVELRRAAGGGAIAVVADEHGNFSVRNIPPGDYHLAATAYGYVRSEYGQKRLNGPGLSITLRDGQEMKDVSMPMTATGAISGQIRGQNGLPAANVQVHALQYGYEDGRRVLKTMRVLTTNDRGDYRLYWLPPGKYVLMAVPLFGDTNDTILIVGGDGTVRGFTGTLGAPTGNAIVLPGQSSNIPIFYPGTIRAQDASVLELTSGEDKTGIDLTLMRTQSFRVSGTLTNLPPIIEGNAAGPPTSASVRLESLSPSLLERRSAPSGMGSVDLRTGAFEIRGVLPGAYNLLAAASAGGRNSGPIFARLPVEVVNADIGNLRVPLAPGFNVSGRFTVEDGQGMQITDLPDLRVSFNQNVAQPNPGQPGSFTARNLQPNRYHIRVDAFPGTPFNGYIKAIRVGDVDVRDSGIALDGPLNVLVEIVISPNGGSISGVATEQSQPEANASVVLIPGATLRSRTDLYRNVRSSADGSFQITGITPGEYKVYAWSDVEDGAWRDPEFMRNYEDRGDAIRVSEGSATKIQVRVIP